MCLITFAYKVHPDYRLLLVANRDEFYDRPCELAHPWPESPNIIAGRDVQAGGSWLGINTSGRLACVTNFREALKEPASLSRGKLVLDFLTGTTSPERWVTTQKPSYRSYNGFNLLLGDSEQLYYTSNRSDLTTAISPGIYSLSNHLLDSPWPKAEYAKRQLKQLVTKKHIDTTEMVALLRRATPFADQLLPATGISLEMERTLSAPFIQTAHYGTRCTTAIAWRYDNQIDFCEQSYLPTGKPGKLREYQLRVTS